MVTEVPSVPKMQKLLNFPIALKVPKLPKVPKVSLEPKVAIV